MCLCVLIAPLGVCAWRALYLSTALVRTDSWYSQCYAFSESDTAQVDVAAQNPKESC